MGPGKAVSGAVKTPEKPVDWAGKKPSIALRKRPGRGPEQGVDCARERSLRGPGSETSERPPEGCFHNGRFSLFNGRSGVSAS